MRHEVSLTILLRYLVIKEISISYCIAKGANLRVLVSIMIGGRQATVVLSLILMST